MAVATYINVCVQVCLCMSLCVGGEGNCSSLEVWVSGRETRNRETLTYVRYNYRGMAL